MEELELGGGDGDADESSVKTTQYSESGNIDCSASSTMMRTRGAEMSVVHLK
jgi:hypothetical protein